ncbi:MAG: hypothetical protein QOE91_1462 [Gaiellaceae bacterium]|nr:hypothetical protein [Gaiellaceae bacterium]
MPMPPPPTITRAWHDDQHFYVDLLLPRISSECPAVSLLVTASSKADGANQALPVPGGDTLPGGDGRLRAYRPGPAHVVLQRPILDLPPYMTLASANGPRGERSPTARYPIPEHGDYCLRHLPVADCVRRAQALAKRCDRGEAPRPKCASWAYGGHRPYPATPVKDATVAAVQANLRAVLSRQLANDVRLTRLTCTAGLTCIATFQRQPGEGRMRVRYTLSGYHQRRGCWFATTIDVIEPPELAPPSPLQAGVPLNNQASCLSWRTP